VKTPRWKIAITATGVGLSEACSRRFATVRLTIDEMRTEFVCIPRPITRSDRPDGGPLRYRVVHTASLWKPGERPLLRQQVIEGDPGLSI
jgi:alkaline phosphatase D